MSTIGGAGVGIPPIVAAILIAAALAGCGKVGALNIPPDSTYPKVYPKAAAKEAAPVESGPGAQGAAFTPSGAWIDPNVRRPTVDPYADVDHSSGGGHGLSPQSP